MVSGVIIKGILVIPTFIIQYEGTASISVYQTQVTVKAEFLQDNPELKVFISMSVYDIKLIYVGYPTQGSIYSIRNIPSRKSQKVIS